MKWMKTIVCTFSGNRLGLLQQENIVLMWEIMWRYERNLSDCWQAWRYLEVLYSEYIISQMLWILALLMALRKLDAYLCLKCRGWYCQCAVGLCAQNWVFGCQQESDFLLEGFSLPTSQKGCLESFPAKHVVLGWSIFIQLGRWTLLCVGQAAVWLHVLAAAGMNEGREKSFTEMWQGFIQEAQFSLGKVVFVKSEFDLEWCFHL